MGGGEVEAREVHGAVLPTASLRYSEPEGFGIQVGAIAGYQGSCGHECFAADVWGIYASAEAATTMPSFRAGLTWGAWPFARLSLGAACRKGRDWDLEGALSCGPELEAEYMLFLGRVGVDPAADGFNWGLGFGF